MIGPSVIYPDWPVPSRVHAAMTTRLGGVSDGVFAGCNLGLSAGDDAAAVAANRARVATTLDLPAAPCWLVQQHGTRCVAAEEVARDATPADAVWTATAGRVCSVLVADCLPVLLARDDGAGVAAAHAGWRGLAGGVVESAVAALGGSGERVLAWLGPAIGPDAFEVGAEVRSAFVEFDPEAANSFTASASGRWYADLYGLARRRLAQVGVHRVYGGGWCTYADPQRFYSYRRDGTTGRMAALVWLMSG